MFLPSRYKFYCILARSRYNTALGQGFIALQDFDYAYWRSVAVQTISEPEIYHGTEFKLCADERVRVQESLQICLGSRNKSKNRDKQLTYIVRVSWRPVLNLKRE